MRPIVLGAGFLPIAAFAVYCSSCQLTSDPAQDAAEPPIADAATTGGGEEIDADEDPIDGGDADPDGGTTTCSTGSRGLPCDIYAAEGGPCVAAHSTVRALSKAYRGPLYQVKRGDGTTRDIGLLAPGGLANAAEQDAFCGPDACTISVIYDQSGKGNHLTKAPAGGMKKTPDNEADAKALPITIGGHTVYGVHIPPGVGYRNNKPNGTTTGDNAETMYAVMSGDYFNNACCFDYGNAETNSMDNGEGTMEAIYFGSCSMWGKGGGAGPWVMGDLENGLWAGDTNPYNPNRPITFKLVTAILKGDVAGANHWALRAGNAQAGSLRVLFDGPRPSTRYNPMRKEGAIILGTGGDNSASGRGNFFEGLMTTHFSTEAADTYVQANIVATYGGQ